MEGEEREKPGDGGGSFQRKGTAVGDAAVAGALILSTVFTSESRRILPPRFENGDVGWLLGMDGTLPCRSLSARIVRRFSSRRARSSTAYVAMLAKFVVSVSGRRPGGFGVAVGISGEGGIFWRLSKKETDSCWSWFSFSPLIFAPDVSSLGVNSRS